MQQREWNNLFDGNLAKYAELNNRENQKLVEILSNKQEVKKNKEEIEKNETEIPVELTKEMHLFIKSLQDKGLSKRNIRRAFERKFNVKIV